MPKLEYGKITVDVDDRGYLLNFDDWNETVACALAEKEGVEELTKERMDILRFIREYYKKYNFFPILNAVCKNLHQPKDCVSVQFMSPLQAWKVAGFPKPDEEIINILEGQTPG